MSTHNIGFMKKYAKLSLNYHQIIASSIKCKITLPLFGFFVFMEIVASMFLERIKKQKTNSPVNAHRI